MRPCGEGRQQKRRCGQSTGNATQHYHPRSAECCNSTAGSAPVGNRAAGPEGEAKNKGVSLQHNQRQAGMSATGSGL